MMRTIKSFLSPLYRPVKSAVFYFKSKKIAQSYAAHYQQARGVFQKNHCNGDQNNSIYQTRACEIQPGKENPFLKLPQNYLQMIETMHKDIDEKFNYSKNCRFFPKLESMTVPERTKDISNVRNGHLIALQLKSYLDIDGLYPLCSWLVPEIEKNVFNSYVIVDKVYIYRSLVSQCAGQVSWVWHYDNHPKELMKIMIYLTDVDEKTGPLEYLHSKKTNDPFWISPKPLLGYSRISEKFVRKLLEDGYEAHKIVGPPGMMILFNENIVHRANVAKKTHRDVLVLQLRPATFRPTFPIDPKWTGSFEHEDFSPNPWFHQLNLKKRMLSN